MIAVFVCQGCHQGENYRELLKRGSRHTRRDTNVRKELADVRGRRNVYLGEVYDFSNPYWRVRYLEADEEELNRHEVKPNRLLQLEPVVRESGPAESRGVWKRGTTPRAMKGKELEASALTVCVGGRSDWEGWRSSGGPYQTWGGVAAGQRGSEKARWAVL